MSGLYRSYIVNWSNVTFMFYLTIVLLSYFLPKIKRRITIGINGHKKYVSSGLFLTEVMLLFIKCFNTSGRDLVGGYYRNFQNAASFEAFPDQTIEKGYIFLNVLVHNIFDSYQFFLVVVGFLTIAPVFHLIRKYETSIDVSVACFMYTAIFFYPGFSLIRISLAASIALYVFDALYEKKMFKAAIMILLASFFHTSMICLVIPYAIMLVRNFDKRLILFMAAGVYLTAYLNQDAFVAILTGRYSNYSIGTEGFGLEQIVYYVPIFVLLLYQRRDKISNSHFYMLSFGYVLSGFFMGMTGYLVPAFGRSYVAFLPLIYILGYYAKRFKGQKNKWLIQLLFLGYGLFRFYMFISQYYNADDIMPYTNIMGWKI